MQVVRRMNFCWFVGMGDDLFFELLGWRSLCFIEFQQDIDRQVFFVLIKRLLSFGYLLSIENINMKKIQFFFGGIISGEK